MKTTTLEGGLSVDDRGSVSFVNSFDFKKVKRFYVVENHAKGFVRAWHGHRHEEKYVFVVQGAALVGCLPLDYKEGDVIERHVLSAAKPQILHIPKGYANGFKTLTDDTKVIFYSTATLAESLKDDERFPAYQWNIWNVEAR
jgi:dTDP-4-dehydrorhamnose 3,5-epimerase-like enzyme